MFIMIDGIDGSGKSTVISVWQEYLTSAGKKVFDLKTYWKEHGHSPTLEDLLTYDVVISGEPTYCGVGAVIRAELIRTGSSYSAHSIAEAYALDRLILYRTLLLPLLKMGKTIIQDRGVSTSFAYQPVADSTITIDYLTSLEGNALALEYRPDYLILLPTTPTIAMNRLGKRTEKQDNVIFERLEFAERLSKRFADPSYQSLFTARGATIKELPGDAELDILKKEAVSLLASLI